MRKMKDSGIEWIGEIPESWSVEKNKHCFDLSKEIVGEASAKTELLSLTTKGVRYKSATDTAGKVPETYDTYQFVHKNDLIMCLFDLDCSAAFSGLSPYNGMVSPAYKILSCNSKLNPHYADYWFQFVFIGRKFMSYSKTLRYTLTYEEFGVLPILCPDYESQQYISAYLDRQCALIDSVTEKTKASIEEYKKLRQAVITQAVTKGVRGDRPMKDSGIEWIGEIPEEWDVVRLKFILSEIVDCPHETPNYTFDGDYYVIRTADEDYGFLRSDDNMYRLNDDEYQNRIRRLSLDKDDIVYGREGERWGLACLVPDSNKYCLGQRMMQFRCKTDTVYPLYLKWALNSWSVYIQGCFDTLGSTSPHVNISTIINYYIPMPCYEEQIELAEYMESKSTAINALITKKETFLAELEAYKKSLIYEYVTGKKEVPQA